MTSWLRVLGGSLALCCLALPAWASEPSVPLQAEVVLASTSAGAIDPSLVRMQEALGAKVKYQSLKKLESQKLSLQKGHPQTVLLPNQKEAQVTFLELKDNVATLKVKVAQTEATYSLGREKSLFFQAGPHQGADLWLVLSQPR